jgi:ethanolaminephosphotransferase
MPFLKQKFLSEQGEKNLPQYKYSGSDKSLLYKHFFSPMAQFLVDHLFPSTLAPNLITLLGFCWTLIPHLLLLYFFPKTLGGDVPSWLCILAGVGQITYMIFDNADGKQARKTKASSPLGLLFDHGCDAMNTFISGLSLFTVLQFGNSSGALIGYVITFGSFFLATWEEYYTESLDLPIFNGANEGLVGVASFFIISGIFGTQIWTIEVHPGYRVNDLVLIGFSIMAVFTVIGNMNNIKSKAPEKFTESFKSLLVFSFLVLTVIIVYNFSVTHVISRTCRYFIYFIGFSFAKLVGILQANHTAHVPFDQFRFSVIIPTLLINGLTIYGYVHKKPLIDEDLVVYGCLAFSILAYCHFALNVIGQFTEILGIYVFKIGKRDVGKKQQ